MTAGPDGALWFTYSNWNGPVEGIGRMTQAGDFTLTPIPGFCGDSLVFGRDGALWVSGGRCNPSKLFRIVFGGAMTTFDVTRPAEVTTGPDGNVWFANDMGPAVGRVGLDGS
jgi:streptogramin lyase